MHNGGHTVKVASEVDRSNAGQLGQELEQFATGDLVIDCADLEIIDSAGLKVIAVAHKRLLDSGGHVRLVTCSEPVTRIVRTIGFAEWLEPSP
jgi:anti-anti-sigma factor